MIAAVIDTHAFIWHLCDDARVSKTVRNFIDEVTKSDRYLVVSSITFIEIAYLMEKSRLPSDTYEVAAAEIGMPNGIFRLVDVSLSVANSMLSVSRDQIPDMPDRIIAATAVCLNVPIITRDGNIRASNIPTIW